MPFFKKLRFSRHKKLCEEWVLANSRERIENDGDCAIHLEGKNNEFVSNAEATFVVKYLGSTLVETPSNEEATAEAIKTIITMSKASSKKLQRVSLAVSLRGIRMTDLATDEDQLQVSMYRISYCSADATHSHVFAFIATNFNETMECHAYLCPKRKIAQTIALTVAQAFNTAYEAWQMSQTKLRIHQKTQGKNSDNTNGNQVFQRQKKEETNQRRNNESNDSNENEKQLLIDLSCDTTESVEKAWVYFEDDDCNRKDTKEIQKSNLCNKNDIPLTVRSKAESSLHNKYSVITTNSLSMPMSLAIQ